MRKTSIPTPSADRMPVSSGSAYLYPGTIATTMYPTTLLGATEHTHGTPTVTKIEPTSAFEYESLETQKRIANALEKIVERFC